MEVSLLSSFRDILSQRRGLCFQQRQFCLFRLLKLGDEHTVVRFCFRQGSLILMQLLALPSKFLGWLGSHYQGGLRESADIMVDFNDDMGFLIRTD